MVMAATILSFDHLVYVSRADWQRATSYSRGFSLAPSPLLMLPTVPDILLSIWTCLPFAGPLFPLDSVLPFSSAAGLNYAASVSKLWSTVAWLPTASFSRGSITGAHLHIHLSTHLLLGDFWDLLCSLNPFYYSVTLGIFTVCGKIWKLVIRIERDVLASIKNSHGKSGKELALKPKACVDLLSFNKLWHWRMTQMCSFLT